MSANKWVYRVSDGLLLLGDGADPSLYTTDQVNYALVDVGATASIPDPRTQRAASATTLRAATAPEIAAYDAARNTATFTATSRRKDILATCALIVRARGIAAWNGMTLQQKKDATLAEADVWVTIRDFIETNL